MCFTMNEEIFGSKTVLFQRLYIEAEITQKHSNSMLLYLFNLSLLISWYADG